MSPKTWSEGNFGKQRGKKAFEEPTKDSEKERDPRQRNEKRQGCGILQKPKERNFKNEMSR